jgi:phytoene synthase
MSASVSARLTRLSESSFYYAFRTLPAEKRRAIYAVYAFCRTVDDCVDEPQGERETGLERWGAELQRAYRGVPETALGRELAETVARFPIPRSAFEDVLAGCRMDLATRRYASFADLRVYCERVASAVGLASIEIFGYQDARTREYAIELGLALQLTNILRDVGPDAARDRIYLPLEDLARFGVGEAELLAAARDPGAPRPHGLAELLGFEYERARSRYAAAASALPQQDYRSMRPARIMGAVYRGVLEEWSRRGRPLGGPRVQLSKPRKLWIALGTLAQDAWRG